MARKITSQVSSFNLGRPMRVHLAFVVGWAFSLVVQRPVSQSPNLALETQLLREEVRAARVAVDSLSEARAVCDWELWSYRWWLRVSGVVDLLLVGWVFRIWIRRQSPPVLTLPSLQADTGGSSSDTEEDNSNIGSLRALPGKGVLVAKGRPLRPSDLRAGKSAWWETYLWTSQRYRWWWITLSIREAFSGITESYYIESQALDGSLWHRTTT